MSENEMEVEDLPVIDDDDERLVDHPEEVTDEEAQEGLAFYRQVDDLDDEDNGL